MSKRSTFRSELRESRYFPTHQDVYLDLGSDLCVIYDESLPMKVKAFKHWIRSFPCTYAVKSGESLKDVFAFPEHIQKIAQLTESSSRRSLVIMAVGGGSVGDFAGFVASVLKRGCRFVQVPSTWLAAIDSAHGGKTALNIGRVKNPIGTFLVPEAVYFVREFFEQSDPVFAEDALGELLKMALIEAPAAWSQKLLSSEENAAELFEQFWKDALEAKYRIVESDPYETLGLREVLNLGHSVGHVIEAFEGCPHGVAVAKGLLFTLRWSAYRQLCPQDYAEKLERTLMGKLGASLNRYPDQLIDQKSFLSLLAQDKKMRSKAMLNFVFHTPNGAELASVNLSQVLAEAIRQGRVKI